jgi:hypothetical protein
MDRRSFFARFGKYVMAASIAGHLHLRELVPVPALLASDKNLEYYVVEWPAGHWWDNVEMSMELGGEVPGYPGARFAHTKTEEVPPQLWTCYKESDPTDNLIICNPHNLTLKPGERILVTGRNEAQVTESNGH